MMNKTIHKLGRVWRVWRKEGWAGLWLRLRRRSYAAWAAAHRLTCRDRGEIRRRILEMPHHPLISVLLPVYDSNPRWLRACLDSVRRQLYPHWELCIADDASTLPHIRAILQAYAARAPRFKVVYRPQNGHISAAANSALELAAGEWVAFLDHDDELAEHALYLVAEEINRHPDADLIYSDEDKMDAHGRLLRPWFKPDWSPDLLRSYNYINHLAAARTALVRRLGGLRVGFEGAQDHDLLLRLSEQTAAARIRHIPHVLYHWRVHPLSAAQTPQAKAYSPPASRRALTEHLQRQGVTAELISIDAERPNRYRVIYALPDPPLVSVIVPTRDRLDLLRVCVNGVRAATDYPAIELIIVDNGSQEPATLDYLNELARQPHTRVLRQDGPFNYSALNNAGAALAAGQVLCFLNNDIIVTHSGWLKELVSQAVRPEVGAAGPLLRYPDGRVQHGGIMVGGKLVARLALHQFPGCPPPARPELEQIRNVAALTGACLVLRRSVLEQVGGFDERLPVAYNDVDLCLKLRAAGYWLIFTPFAELVHIHSASRGPEDTPERRARQLCEANDMHARWGEWVKRDPFTSPNWVWKRGESAPAWSPFPLRPWREEAGERQ